MDLRDYYRRIRDIEAAIPGADALVVSYNTPDGGKQGVMTEAPRSIAARMIAEGRARLATPDEETAFRSSVIEDIAAAEQAALADRLQVAIVSEADIDSLKPRNRFRKD